MIILPNLQDTLSCKYKVLQVHMEMAMYPKYQRMESGIETYKIKNEVEGNYKSYRKLRFVEKILTQAAVPGSNRTIVSCREAYKTKPNNQTGG